MNERYKSHQKSFGYNIKLLLVIDTFEIKFERALHKILENLGNKKFVYKHKNDIKSFKECYILCDIAMETVVNKINEVQKTKQLKIDMLIKKAQREQEFKQFHIQQLENTKQIEFQEETKQIEFQEKTKQLQEETKQLQEKTKQLQENTKQIELQEKTKQLQEETKQLQENTKQMQENTKQMQEKTKQLELQIELLKLQNNLSTIN
jgi:DNA repair exonuclease SbcCD ATPase subunit